MEHFDIEDSFKRLVVPKLRARLALKSGGSRGGAQGRFERLLIEVWLKNESPITARYPYSQLLEISGFNQGPYHGDLRNFAGGADDVVHPNLEIRALHLTHEVAVAIDGAGNKSMARSSDKEIKFSILYGCYNAMPTEEDFMISAEDVADTLQI
jgi:hypothetical protein